MKMFCAESVMPVDSTIESGQKKPLDFSDVFVYTPAYFDSRRVADVILPLSVNEAGII
jgi:hypothetical protein